MKKVLFIDIEGGHGGSSRSLFQSLSYMEKTDLSLEVWCKRDGIKNKYQELNIPCKIFNSMPKFNSLPRISRNLFSLLIFFKDWISNFKEILRFSKSTRRFAHIHLNHEGLFLYALFLKCFFKGKLTMHMRTMLPQSIFSRIQVFIINQIISKLVCITENEEQNFHRLGGKQSLSKVVYNIAPANSKSFQTIDNGLKIVSLSNLSYGRGVDRLVEIAKEAQKRNFKLQFIICGDMAVKENFYNNLNNYSNLEEYVESIGLKSYFSFQGHVSNPEDYLEKSHLLIKLTRESNPWGRDILEALGMGRPVISLGYYKVFLEHKQTGLLYSEYNPSKIIDDLINLKEDELGQLGKNGSERIAKLCEGKQQAKKLKEILN